MTEPATLFDHDVFVRGTAPAEVLRPASIDELAAGLRDAAARGLAVVPRGGGMSYTAGYVADRPGVMLVDMAAMDRVLEIDAPNMTVMVEAGCTWESLHAALQPLGLRVPLWGTLSGVKASIGGGASQNGTFWGARNGAIAHSVLGYKVVLADGSVLDTRAGPLRGFGPDLTGLFGADCGALGVKAHVTLPLAPAAAAQAYGSFAFDEPAAYCAAMSDIARAGLASESFGFDPFLQAQRMRRDSLAADARSLVTMMKAQGGFWKGLREGAKAVAAGRSFLDEARFSIHCIAEGNSQSAADHDMAQIGGIVARHGGRAVENTIPKVLRANPFPPVNAMAGPDGGRWLPVHGIVGHSHALATIEALTALFETHEGAMAEHAIGAGYMFLTLGATGFLIEPCFYWPDELWPLHRASIEPAHLARLNRYPANLAARAVVETLRSGVIEIIARMGGMHFQIGRTYPLESRIDPGAWALLKAVKAALDPDNRMNPGVLGL